MWGQKSGRVASSNGGAKIWGSGRPLPPSNMPVRYFFKKSPDPGISYVAKHVNRVKFGKLNIEGVCVALLTSGNNFGLFSI